MPEALFFCLPEMLNKTFWTAAQSIRCAADIAVEAADPAGVRWMDWRGHDAIMLDGLPRVLV